MEIPPGHFHDKFAKWFCVRNKGGRHNEARGACMDLDFECMFDHERNDVTFWVFIDASAFELREIDSIEDAVLSNRDEELYEKLSRD